MCLRRFGAPAVALRTQRERGTNAKMHAAGAVVRIIGYDENSMSYRCLYPDGTIRLRSSVYADESSLIVTKDGVPSITFNSPLLTSFKDLAVEIVDEGAHPTLPVSDSTATPLDPYSHLTHKSVRFAMDNDGLTSIGKPPVVNDSSLTPAVSILPSSPPVPLTLVPEPSLSVPGTPLELPSQTTPSAPPPAMGIDRSGPTWRSTRSTQGKVPERYAGYVSCAIDACAYSGVEQFESVYFVSRTTALLNCYLAVSNIPVPRNPKEAVHHFKYGEYWRAAILAEWRAMIEGNVLKFTLPEPGEQVLPSHWVFAVKGDEFGELVRFKARWVS